MVVVCCWLSNVSCREMPVGCPVSLSAAVVGFFISGVGCQVFVVDIRCRSRLPLSEFTSALQLPSADTCTSYNIIYFFDI